MKSKMASMTLALSAALALSAQAAETGPVVQAFTCDYNEGKGFSDLLAAGEFFNQQVDALQGDEPTPVFAAALTPYRANVDYDFVFVVASPNLNAMAQGGQNFMTSEQGQASQARFEEVAKCGSAVLSSEQLMDAAPEVEEGDRMAFLETYACTLRPGSTMADVQKAEKSWLAAASAQQAPVDVFRWVPMFANTPADLFYLVVTDGLPEWGAFRTKFSTSEEGQAADQAFTKVTNCESGLMIGTGIREDQIR